MKRAVEMAFPVENVVEEQGFTLNINDLPTGLSAMTMRMPCEAAG